MSRETIIHDVSRNHFGTNLNVSLSDRRIHDSALFAVHHLTLLGVELGRVRRYRSEQLNVPCSMSVLQRCRAEMIYVCNVKDGKQVPVLNSLEVGRMHLITTVSFYRHYVHARLPAYTIALKS